MNPQQSPQTNYVGRFAPSPSGSLHFGSLLSALASYLDAKSNKGKWLVRIDNIDPPREQSGSIQKILDTLESFHLHWDDSVIYQSHNLPKYIESCISLIEEDLAYPCFCSRKELAEYRQYPGNCRKILSAKEKHSLIQTINTNFQIVFNPQAPLILNPLLKEFSIRVNTQGFNKDSLDFTDTLQGSQHTPEDFGDFIILRKDSLPSYMLACGLDDIQNNISHIVRGSDLLEASFWQRFLQIQTLNKQPSLTYAHLPIILNEQQQKLSKQHHATEINTKDSSQLLFLALKALGQRPDSKLVSETAENIVNWAVNHWQLNTVPSNNIIFDSLLKQGQE